MKSIYKKYLTKDFGHDYGSIKSKAIKKTFRRALKAKAKTNFNKDFQTNQA
jgi:ribosomal protein S17E